MRVVETVGQLRSLETAAPRPIGLVPTMGFLHEGHLSLIRRCRQECAMAVVSIFVNPTQFGPNEDLAAYPRNLARDLEQCDAAGVDVVFSPTVEEMYPAGSVTVVHVQALTERWEGASRPGHFEGVATIVAKLFRAAQPQRAYFGEKDYQQLLIVRALARDLLLDVEIVACPIVREPDGLALSSRNVNLDPAARQQATVLSAGLRAAQRRLADGERSGPALEAIMRETVNVVDGAVLDYAAVVDPDTLEPLERVDREARALIAARFGSIRLIDNAPLVPRPSTSRSPRSTSAENRAE